ncbi:MAG TPA: universal stress protein, partial [Vicinamibacterales bacterium]|nr:universal stress protein [Vicinamibacterales bacterium]
VVEPGEGAETRHGCRMRAINQILCPVDLSDVTNHTLNHATVLARWYGSKVTLLHVANPIAIPVVDYAMVGAGIIPRPLTDDERASAVRDVLSCASAPDVSYADIVVQSGSPSQRILDCARSLPADLVVIGTHGISGFVHLVLGSVTEKVLRQATCPVMTVPPRARSTSTLPFKRILCPVDFSEPSLAALEFAFSLAHEGDADLTVMHVFEWPDQPLTDRPIQIPEYRRELEHDAIVRLESLVPQDERDRCRPAARMAYGKPYRKILGAAVEDRADLIVMGVHGRNALDLMLFGSTTNQVVRRATCPVLTLRK